MGGRMRNFWGAGLALALMCAPIGAKANNFLMCDGYDQPNSKADGLSTGTVLWGLASATTDNRRASIPLGQRGLQACDGALTDPLLLDAYWLRRANLLQAKGLHALSLGQHDLVLQSLDQSDALGAKDPLFGGSLGLANRAIRAFALIDAKRKDAALAEIALLERARPWSASVRRLAFLLRMRLDPGAFSARLREDIPLLPENALALFWNALSDGDYAAARDYAPVISFELPKMRGGWQIEGEGLAALTAIEDRAEVAGAWAFALAMTGDIPASDAVLAGAEADLVEAAAPPPARPDGKPPRKRDVEAWEERVPFTQTGRGKLGRWRTARDLVMAAGKGSASDDLGAFSASSAAKLPVLPALFARLKVSDPVEIAARDQVLAGYRAGLVQARVKVLDLTIDRLIPLLPRHQTAKMIPVLKPAGDGYFLSDTGLSRAREGTTDVWTLRFVHKFAPIQVVEEMAMLGAAVTALREGKDSFVILSRRSAILTTRLTSMYTGTSEVNSGYEAQLRVQFVNRAALPPELAGTDWRVLQARDVLDALSQRYRQSSGATIAW